MLGLAAELVLLGKSKQLQVTTLLLHPNYAFRGCAHQLTSITLLIGSEQMRCDATAAGESVEQQRGSLCCYELCTCSLYLGVL